MDTDANRWVNVLVTTCENYLVIASIGQWRRKQSQHLKMRIEEEVWKVWREKRRCKLRRGGNLECFCSKWVQWSTGKAKESRVMHGIDYSDWSGHLSYIEREERVSKSWEIIYRSQWGWNDIGVRLLEVVS